MNLKNIKIGTQLKISFAALLLFFIVLGGVSLIQTYRVHQQTKTMYQHPLQVQLAIGNLRSDVLAIHRDMKDLVIASDQHELATSLSRIENWKTNAFEQIDVLYNQYLGPRYNIDSVKQDFIIWNTMREETIKLIREGKIAEAGNRTKLNGIAGRKVEDILSGIDVIYNFAQNKAKELYENSNRQFNKLVIQLLLLIALVLLLSLLVNFILYRNISYPLNELTVTTKRFQDGDLNARSSFTSKNEFGILSDSFNTLANSIQLKTDLDQKFATLAALMLSEYDIKKFFQATLNLLAEHTGSQMAAIYLLSDDKKTFDHYESFGTGNNARKSFAADSFEGEFGSVLSSRKIQHIKNISEETRFIFNTVIGKFIPHEILTLPILNDNEVVAIVSLASVNNYSQQSLQLIDRILVTLCARVEGILAFHKIKEFSGKLEHQNLELEAQKTELASQSAELTEQNTELEMQKNQLGEASRLKTNFLSNMSHELRTPLNSVIALSGVLNRRLANQIPAEEYSYLEVIERNGKHLLELINDILDISRIESGREEMEIAQFNPCTLVNEVVEMIHPQAKMKNIELTMAISDCDFTIVSDAAKCRHIIQNLINNAVKFTEKGKVEISGKHRGENIEIKISDTGIGISEEHLSHIFDEFRQADSSTSRRFGGTGLGLAIAKKYANLLGGTISVKSTPDKGSEFTLQLPIHFSPENRVVDTETINVYRHNPINPQPQFKSGSSSTRKTILLVEDSEPAIIQLKDILSETDYNIVTARNGVEALEIIGHTIPDAMILDLMMPVVDGFSVLKTLREAESTLHVPVLILTAKHITKEELHFLKRNNIHQLIQKGDIKRNELLDAISAMVNPKSEETLSFKREIQIIEGKPVVLIVEDNPDNMVTVKAILAGEFTVIEAIDGNEGIDLAKKHNPNLILMDIGLPGIDGIDTFKAIRSNAQMQHIPIIALTASAMTSDRETILAHGFDGYIAKPIEEETFFKTINEILFGA